jgi:hypothetical protein
MAKPTGSKKLYKRMRASGVRKRVARTLAELPKLGADGKRAPKPSRQAVKRLTDVVAELERHAKRGDRAASGRKAARTRAKKASRRSNAARKAAKARASH